MTFVHGLINARSHIIFLIGLFAAFGLVFYLETAELSLKTPVVELITKTDNIPETIHADLSEEEQQWAETAWVYFKNNYQPETGLVNSVDNYTTSTMWDTASYLLALISAYRLDVIEQTEFDEKLLKSLQALSKIPLFDGQLPNKAYSTTTLQMTNYQNEVSERGIGWSAIDIGRILVPLNIITWNYPKYIPEVKAILAHWKLDKILIDGELHGAQVDEVTDETVYVQEGRLGYEEYSAKSFNLLALDVSKSMNYKTYLAYTEIYGLKIPIDSRDPAIFHAHNYVVSESYILDGLEYGWDYISREFAYRIYKAQEERYLETGLVTAVSEDNINQAPHFVYNTVYTDGKAWNAITEDGQDASKYKTISTKAAIGWSVLYKTAYSETLREAVKKLNDPKKGWYSGFYEKLNAPNDIITANTNAIILETLCFKKFGRLLTMYNDNKSKMKATIDQPFSL